MATGRDKSVGERALGFMDDVEVTRDNCMRCGVMLPDASHSNLLSFLRYCYKCQYNFVDILDWGPKDSTGTLITDISGYGARLHGWDEIIKTREGDVQYNRRYRDIEKWKMQSKKWKDRKKLGDK